MSSPRVVAVSLSPVHGFSKASRASIRLIAGEGVEGDAHRGATTQHLYLKRKDASLPNLAQVHLLAQEKLDALARAGFLVAAGELGENVLTAGIDLMSLPLGTVLRCGTEAMLEVTGVRTPCSQIDSFCAGLQQHMWGGRGDDGKRARDAGVMAIVLRGGDVYAGDAIVVQVPAEPHLPLPPV